MNIIKPHLITLLFLLILFASCKKESKTTTDCFPTDPTSRQITDQQATVKLIDGTFYIVEKGAIDTQLKPCNLSKDFEVDNLQVMVSGKVKGTIFCPCCTANFVIIKISK